MSDCENASVMYMEHEGIGVVIGSRDMSHD